MTQEPAPWDCKDIHTVYLCTSRFNNQTYAENRIAKQRLGFKCMYCSLSNISSVYSSDYLFVLEMNNEENQIIGIGYVQNILSDIVYRIYSNKNYDQRHFYGEYHVHRDQMNEKELEFLKMLELTCFYGKDNLKRGMRMTRYPDKKLNKFQEKGVDVLEDIKSIFNRVYKNDN